MCVQTRRTSANTSSSCTVAIARGSVPTPSRKTITYMVCRRRTQRGSTALQCRGSESPYKGKDRQQTHQCRSPSQFRPYPSQHSNTENASRNTSSKPSDVFRFLQLLVPSLVPVESYTGTPRGMVHCSWTTSCQSRYRIDQESTHCRSPSRSD